MPSISLQLVAFRRRCFCTRSLWSAAAASACFQNSFSEAGPPQLENTGGVAPAPCGLCIAQLKPVLWPGRPPCCCFAAFRWASTMAAEAKHGGSFQSELESSTQPTFLHQLASYRGLLLRISPTTTSTKIWLKSFAVAKVQPPKPQSQLPTAFHTESGTLRAQHTSCVWNGVHHKGSILRTHGMEWRSKWPASKNGCSCHPHIEVISLH